MEALPKERGQLRLDKQPVRWPGAAPQPDPGKGRRPFAARCGGSRRPAEGARAFRQRQPLQGGALGWASRAAMAGSRGGGEPRPEESEQARRRGRPRRSPAPSDAGQSRPSDLSAALSLCRH